MSGDHGHDFTGACPDGSQTDIAVDSLNGENIGIGNAAPLPAWHYGRLF